MRFTHLALIGERPKPEAHPKELNTLGDHILKKRLELGLFQKEVARQIGVDKSTVYNWETNRNEPLIGQIPGIIQFLGYVPYTPSPSFPEWLRLVRSCLGMSQRQLAAPLHVDPTTVARWERRGDSPCGWSREQIKTCLL